MMENILEFLDSKMTKPLLYKSFSESWFHYLFLLILVIGFYFAVTKMKNLNRKSLNKVFLTYALVLWIFEIYKQIIFTYQADWNYQWYAFPFQFCSVPMFVALIIPFIKNEKLYDGMQTFLGTFAFFAGTAVMIYPSTVFVTTIGINIQTMIHHGVMSVIGLGLLVNVINLNWKSFLRSMLVFLFLIVIAISLNLIHNTWIKNGTFNMFFINPIYSSGLPVLELFQPHVSPFLFILIYYFGFSFVALLIFWIRKAFLFLKKENKTIYQSL